MKLKPVFEDNTKFECTDLLLHSLAAPSGGLIWSACHEIAHQLINKNISYGDSALNPKRFFSKADNIEQLNRSEEHTSELQSH